MIDFRRQTVPATVLWVFPSFPRGGTGVGSDGMPLLSSAEAMLVFFSSMTVVSIPMYFLRMNASERYSIHSARWSSMAA